MKRGVVAAARMPEGGSLVIGRTSECAIKIMHAIVSAQTSASSRLEGNIVVVADLGSTNGTFCLTERHYFDIDSYLSKRIRWKSRGTARWTAIHERLAPRSTIF